MHIIPHVPQKHAQSLINKGLRNCGIKISFRNFKVTLLTYVNMAKYCALIFCAAKQRGGILRDTLAYDPIK